MFKRPIITGEELDKTSAITISDREGILKIGIPGEKLIKIYSLTRLPNSQEKYHVLEHHSIKKVIPFDTITKKRLYFLEAIVRQESQGIFSAEFRKGEEKQKYQLTPNGGDSYKVIGFSLSQ